MVKMKNIFIIILFSLSLIMISVEANEKKKYLLPPFENFSQYKSKTDYEITFNDINDPSILIKRIFPIDQYSESARSILENKIIKNNVKVIERLRIDQMLSESRLTNKNGFINRESALEMGKTVGADTLIMGTILNIQSKEEEIKAYGINQKIISTICTIRIRVIDIKSGNVYFSKITKGKSDTFSSEHGGTTDSDRAYSALENSINVLTNSSDFINAIN